MAAPQQNSPPTRLILQPRPWTTRYNRLVQYGAVIIGGTVVVVYLLVVNSHRQPAQWERPAHFVSANRPLIMPEKPPPPSPPPPEPQTFTPLPRPNLPPPGSTPTRPAANQPKPNPDIERRKQALLKALTAKVLVEDFRSDTQQK